MNRRYHVYALVTESESRAVKQAARARGLSVSDFVRRGVNHMLLDEGDDPILLEEKTVQRGRPQKSAEA